MEETILAGAEAEKSIKNVTGSLSKSITNVTVLEVFIAINRHRVNKQYKNRENAAQNRSYVQLIYPATYNSKRLSRKARHHIDEKRTEDTGEFRTILATNKQVNEKLQKNCEENPIVQNNQSMLYLHTKLIE